MPEENPTKQTDTDEHPPSTERRLTVGQICLIAITVTAIGATLRVASVVVLPLVVGIWLALLLWPIHDRLRRFLPVWISAILSVTSALLTLLLFGAFAWYAGERAADHIQSNQPAYASKYQTIRSHAEDLGIPAPWLPRWNTNAEDPQSHDGWDDSFNPQQPDQQTDQQPDERTQQNDDQPRSQASDAANARAPNEQDATDDTGIETAGTPRAEASDQPRNASGATGNNAQFLGRSRQEFLSWITGGLRSGLAILGTLTLTLLFVVLALVEFPTWRHWSSRAFGPQRAELIGSIARINAKLIRRYFVAKLITGAVSGTATAAFLWAMGVPMPLVWGLLTLVMNFIPNIGAVISGIPPTALALLELGLIEGVIVACGLLAIETLVGNLLDPLIQGDALDLSPFVVLASLLFWGWLWGIIGAVLAPTLTAAIVTAFRTHASHRHLNEPRNTRNHNKAKRHPTSDEGIDNDH